MEIGPRAVRSAVGRWQAQAVRISLQPGVEMAAVWISLQSGVELQERERMRIETKHTECRSSSSSPRRMPLAWVSESQIESIAERSDRQVSAVGGDGGGGGGGGVLTVGGRQDAEAMEERRRPDAGVAAAAPSR